ncbi:MAG: HAMP domain-containing histidine kinase [Lentisphaeraceae bacterium]|nr:HAMP domain-containing histidine kinase [Lentisphaeraceae bacterium]
MNSVKDKFIKLQGVFILLAVLVTAQMIILYFLQSNQTGVISEANKINQGFMFILQKENELYEKISAFRDSPNQEDFQKLKDEFTSLKSEMTSWSTKGVESLLLPDAIIKDEMRRLLNLQKALDLFMQKNTVDGDLLLALEKKVFFDRVSVIKNVLDRVIADSRQTSSFISIFFLVIILLNIPVFIVLLMMTRQLFTSFSNDVSSLTEIAESITRGQKYDTKETASIKETQRLFDAFKNMELELINRNMLSKDEVDRTKKSNEQLEQKIEKSSHEIIKTNEMLEKKNMELEQILYAASHDLRTPLIGVQGFSQELQYLCDLLKEEISQSGVAMEEGAKLQEILDKDIPNSVNYIINGSNKMDTMIQGLLRISRVGLEELQIAEIDMNEFVRQIVDGLSFQAQSANAMIITNELENCRGDKDKLEQVFTNLIVNAIKYRKEDQSCEINISCEKTDDEVKYIVADNGKGISEVNLKKIFNTFFRIDIDSANGEGLGLTIANRIIEKHMGRLEVESVEGEGSKFFIILPLSSEKAEKPAEPENKEEEISAEDGAENE